ncbi:hypothetical protein EAH87_08115 [Sphingomonas koreensis]|nr:hypothetical protein EAH87_08115 [Sphingomonas koreensis]
MATDDPFSIRQPRRRSRWTGPLVLAVLVFIAGLAAMALIVRYESGWLAWTGITAPTESAAVRHVVSAPINPNAPQVLGGADYDALAAREATLAARVADLEARIATVDTQATAASGNATRAEGLLIAFAARRALDRGLGLGYIEGQLRERFGATQPRAVATVIQASRAPVTIEDLRLGLDSIAPDIVNSGTRDAWWPSLRNTLSNLIVLHKEGTPSPRPSDRLTQARHLLEGGQVEAALAEISQLPGASKAQRWTLAARRYIDSRRALDVIETAAIIGQASIAATAQTPARPPNYEIIEPDAAPTSN